MIYNQGFQSYGSQATEMQVGSVFYDNEGRRCVITSISSDSSGATPTEESNSGSSVIDGLPAAPTLDDDPREIEGELESGDAEAIPVDKSVEPPAEIKPVAPSQF